jgi:hypothetical protein
MSEARACLEAFFWRGRDAHRRKETRMTTTPHHNFAFHWESSQQSTWQSETNLWGEM